MSNMYVITERDVILGAQQHWNERFPEDDYKFWDGITAGEKRGRLNALDLKTCSRDDVNNALGTFSWADCTCSICGQPKERVLHLGDEPDYEARYVRICEDCLALANAKLEKKGRK